ncbi:MAG TPA: CPBP family intramembrane glutamic endopeptidase [Candidatus Binatus sp.]|nr:CPBP family intramembrane glutamic endopeptidase [Candidatus Binatus sp.]
MKSLQALPIHHRLLFFLLAVLAFTCVISPWLALGADWAVTRWPDILSERIPFSRVFNRAFMFAGIILFIMCRRLFVVGQIKSLIAVDRRAGCRDLFIGFGLAWGSMIVLVMLMIASGIFTPLLRMSAGGALGRFASAAAAGLFTGALEELFFRAILFKGLYDAGNPLRAYLAANLFYSALHFVKPGEAYFLDHFDPLAGFAHLLTTFAPFLDLLPLLPGLFGLLLIGIVLSYAVIRSGKLYLSIGLHAGWVFSLKIVRVFGNFTRQDLGWLYGSTNPKIVSGVATWIGVTLVGVAIYFVTKNRSDRSHDRLRATAA